MTKTLILDIDLTLVHAHFFDEAQFNSWKADPINQSIMGRVVIIPIVDVRDDCPKGLGTVSYCVATTRPYLKEFLKFCLDYFDKVCIWSAGHKRYVYAIMSAIMSVEDYQRIDKIFTKKDCKFINKAGDILLKELASKGFDMQHTLIIDDNHHSFGNNPDNAIYISAYDPHFDKEKVLYDERSLLRIMEWFQQIRILECNDVRCLDKKQIFPKLTIPKTV